MAPSPSLKRCSQGELNLSRVVGLTGNQTERRTSKGCIRGSELNSVENVEELDAEIEFDPFRQWGELCYGEIPSVYPLRAQSRIDARLVAETEWSGSSKARGVYDGGARRQMAENRAAC